MSKHKDWADKAIDAWVNRGPELPAKGNENGSKEWEDVAIDSWIARRARRLNRSS